MTAPRLSPAILADLPRAVARPAYDRGALSCGWAHLGVGAFHRSHQAEYADDLAALGETRWGLHGINIRAPAIEDLLGAQDGLYTRVVTEGAQREARVIGAIRAVTDSQRGAGPALSVLTDPALQFVTLTVTEKGYCHRPATGAPDADNAGLLHDRAHPEAPVTVPGILLRALELRCAAGAAGLTLASCDNIPSNGTILGTAVMDLARRRDAGLARWIESACAFPESMVDRIAPAVTETDMARLTADHGYADAGMTVCEGFRQWVIEDRFAHEVPPLARAGVTVTDDVAAFEILKMRVLNGAQTTLALLGAICGLETTADDMADPVLAAFTERMLRAEILPTLRPVPGIEAAEYLATSLARCRNTAIRHRNHQIATDTSQKIVQRLLRPAAERIERGQGAGLIAVPVAAFIAYLACAAPRLGARWQPDDPYAARLAALAETTPDIAALAGRAQALDGIFLPRLAADARFSAAVADALAGLLGPDPRGWLRARLAGEKGAEAGLRGPGGQG